MDELREEIWKPTPIFGDRYEVSNYGRVRRWVRGGGYRLSKPYYKEIQKDKDGYPFVVLYKKPKVKGYRISRLVLETFIEKPSGKMEASHLDGDKDNNELSNLVWETHYDNEQRKKLHGTYQWGEIANKSRLTENDVREIRRLRKLGLKLKLIGRMFLMTEVNASAICRRATWKHV